MPIAERVVAPRVSFAPVDIAEMRLHDVGSKNGCKVEAAERSSGHVTSWRSTTDCGSEVQQQ